MLRIIGPQNVHHVFYYKPFFLKTAVSLNMNVWCSSTRTFWVKDYPSAIEWSRMINKKDILARLDNSSAYSREYEREYCTFSHKCSIPLLLPIQIQLSITSTNDKHKRQEKHKGRTIHPSQCSMLVIATHPRTAKRMQAIATPSELGRPAECPQVTAYLLPDGVPHELAILETAMSTSCVQPSLLSPPPLTAVTACE